MTAIPYLPSSVGFDALAELERVDWSALNHAYGLGVIGEELPGDVARSLALLRDDPLEALDVGLWSNICHQGTVYEATAFAVPFIAAVAAGDVSSDLRASLCVLLGEIAINGSFLAPGGSHTGASGDGVDLLIRRTLTSCEQYWDLIEKLDPRLMPLVSAIQSVASEPSDQRRQMVLDIIDPED